MLSVGVTIAAGGRVSPRKRNANRTHEEGRILGEEGRIST